MKLNLTLILKILGAVSDAETALKSGKMKRAKVIDVAIAGAKVAREHPKGAKVIGAFVDSVVTFQNGLDR